MYYKGDIILSSEGVWFKCPSYSEVVRISEDMSLDTLRKTITYSIEGSGILLNLFYRQLVYVGDGRVEYKCIELKRNDDEKILFHFFKI